MDRNLELVKRAQNGDDNAKDLIIKENSALIWSIVKRFLGRGYEADDLYQIGAIGLLKCIDKFDLNYDVKFSTYAVPMIMGEIKRFLRDDGMIKVSRSLKEIALKARLVKENMVQLNGYEPSMSELSNVLEISTEELALALEASLDVESLYSTIHQGDGTPVLLVDKIVCDEDYENNMINIIALRQLIDTLTPKEQKIISMRYFDDKTQSEIANVIGISQVQVSRIEKKILDKLRKNFA